MFSMDKHQNHEKPIVQNYRAFWPCYISNLLGPSSCYHLHNVLLEVCAAILLQDPFIAVSYKDVRPILPQLTTD